MSQLLAHVQTFFPDSLGQLISPVVGEPEELVRQGIKGGVAVILLGLDRLAQADAAGLDAVQQALANEAKSGLLEHLETVWQGQGLDLLSRQGDAYLNRIFRGDRAETVQALARARGLSLGGAERLLALMSPVVVAVLGRQAELPGVTINDVTRALREQKQGLISQMPGPLRNLFIPVAAREQLPSDAPSAHSLLLEETSILATARQQAHPDLQAPPPPPPTQKLSGDPALPVLPRPAVLLPHDTLPLAQGYRSRKKSSSMKTAMGLLVTLLLVASAYWWHQRGRDSLRAVRHSPSENLAVTEMKPAPSPAAAVLSTAHPGSEKGHSLAPPSPGPSLLALPPNDPALTIGVALLPLPGIKGSLNDLQAMPSDDLLSGSSLSISSESGAGQASLSKKAAPVPGPSETPVNPVVPDPVVIPLETVKLPNGRQARIHREGMDGQLHDFLTRAKPGSSTLVFDEVTFAEGSTAPEELSSRQLEAVAALLKAWPEVAATVQAHTDSGGKGAVNQTLSQARAAALRKQLLTLGARAGQVEARGLGATKPLVPNTSEENRLKNRRVELVVKRK